jgi:hypothetical protein
MSISINSDRKLLLYADDSTILFSHKDPQDISKKLGKELESCSNWLVDNKLPLYIWVKLNVSFLVQNVNLKGLVIFKFLHKKVLNI